MRWNRKKKGTKGGEKWKEEIEKEYSKAIKDRSKR
jgi:hypothetical protein